MSSDNGASTRRDFLKVAGTTAAGVLAAGSLPERAAAQSGGTKSADGIPVPVAKPKQFEAGKFPKAPVMAKGRAIGANDRINVGFVGAGGQGFGAHVRNFTRGAKERNTESIAVCDVFSPRVDRAKKNIMDGGAAQSVMTDKDYRKLLDNKDIDVIVISTPEHWHAQVACHAMEAGKHVYIEKPMTRYLDEAFQVYDTAQRTGRIVQVGAQRSTEEKYHVAGQAVRDGKVGKLVMGQDSYMRNNPNGEWNYTIEEGISPETLDWKMWLGSAPDRPFTNPGPAASDQQREREDAAARFARYRKFWDYSAGILGDLMPHTLHPYLIASGNPEFPSVVTSVATKQITTEREVPDTIQVTAEFPSGWTMFFIGSTVNEQGIPQLLRGHKGTLYFGGGSVELRPERPYAEEIERATLLQNSPGEDVFRHEANWLNAIRTNTVPSCNVDLATKVQTIVSLAEMAQRMGKTMHFDPKTRKVTSG